MSQFRSSLRNLFNRFPLSTFSLTLLLGLFLGGFATDGRFFGKFFDLFTTRPAPAFSALNVERTNVVQDLISSDLQKEVEVLPVTRENAIPGGLDLLHSIGLSSLLGEAIRIAQVDDLVYQLNPPDDLVVSANALLERLGSLVEGSLSLKDRLYHDSYLNEAVATIWSKDHSAELSLHPGMSVLCLLPGGKAYLG